MEDEYEHMFNPPCVAICCPVACWWFLETWSVKNTIELTKRRYLPAQFGTESVPILEGNHKEVHLLRRQNVCETKACRHVTIASSILRRPVADQLEAKQVPPCLRCLSWIQDYPPRSPQGWTSNGKVHKTIRNKNQFHRNLHSHPNWYTFHHSPVWQAQPLSTSIGTCSCPSHHAMANLVVNRLTLSLSIQTPWSIWLQLGKNFHFLN